MKFLLNLAAVSLVAASAFAQDPDATASPDASPTPAPASPDAMEIPVPVGVPVKGIKIPYYGEDGKVLQMTFDAEVAKKIDDTFVEMDNLDIEAFDDDGKKFYIEVPRSVLNMETRVLTGDKGVTIRREDFEIVGDGLEFHTKTRNGKVLGNVKMTILSLDNFEE